MINEKQVRQAVSFTKEQDLAIKIINLFEELLDRDNIDIPNNERDEYDDDNMAHIFGSDYYSLEDKIVELLNNSK